MDYIELFSGIGAFTQAIERIDPEANCVFAADINEDCARVYWNNYKIKSLCDITKQDENDVPNHDFCFFSPPCQAFSKGGFQRGFEEARGTLIFDVFRILKVKHPQYILMENVRNLVSHDNGHTIQVILNGLHDLGYRTPKLPLILSPHQFGIPQLRERAFLPGIFDPDKSNEPLDFDLGTLLTKEQNSIESIIDYEEHNPVYNLRPEEIDVMNAWDDFYQHINETVIGFPVWADYFKNNTDISNYPDWKQDFVNKNTNLYHNNQRVIDRWISYWDIYNRFTPTHRKFEWQCGNRINSIKDSLIQFRPSGMRVKVPNTAPALVAMVQTSIIGKLERRMSLKECLRLQDFPETFDFGEQTLHESYKQLGNSICVGVLEKVTRKLLEIGENYNHL